MPRPIGFSTGSLAPGDIPRALRMVAGLGSTAVELSSLRSAELDNLLDSLPALDLADFRYISVHAPSRFRELSESEVITRLQPIKNRGWTVVLHPDSLTHWPGWNSLGPLACIENMDNRKGFGHSVEDLQSVFNHLPDATFCFDIGHARQLDPNLGLARALVHSFNARLRQVHLSGVNALGNHEPLTPRLIEEFKMIFDMIPNSVPIILETPVTAEAMAQQLKFAQELA